MADTGVQNAIEKRDSRLLGDDTAMGHVAEQAVAIHLARLVARHGGRLHYGPPHNGREMDFILEVGGGTIPVEAKYRKTVRRSDLAAVRAYSEGVQRGPDGCSPGDGDQGGGGGPGRRRPRPSVAIPLGGVSRRSWIGPMLSRT